MLRGAVGRKSRGLVCPQSYTVQLPYPSKQEEREGSVRIRNK